jgi:Family of unknown function (DUF6788)
MPRRRPRRSPRTQRSPQERDARSQAVQRVADQALLRGSLVRMQRTCGKKNCRCQQGQKHPALCLAIRVGEQRKMIYIPRALEDVVRRWVETGQEVDGLLDAISQHCLEALLAKKKETLARTRKEKPP